MGPRAQPDWHLLTPPAHRACSACCATSTACCARSPRCTAATTGPGLRGIRPDDAAQSTLVFLRRAAAGEPPPLVVS